MSQSLIKADKTDRYARRFAELRQRGSSALIPFTLLGWPNHATSLAMIQAMIESGATALELGIAFSDPMADGPTIQAAAMETLANGFTVNDAMALLRDVRQLDAEIPIGLLVYFNTVLARGIDRFFDELAEIGVDGVLVVDLPPETGGEVIAAAERAWVQLIYIVSPLTTTERLKVIARHAGGFLYAVSRLGITGTEERYDDELQSLLGRVREVCELPVCVGFGISTPAHARKMTELGADGVIVGSRIIQLAQGLEKSKIPAVLRDYLREMQEA